jgi:hypothetical protein
VVTKWKALHNWTPDYFTQPEQLKILDKLEGVYRHSTRIFGPYWDPSRPMASMGSIIRKNPHRVLNMTMTKFISKIKATENATDFFYYSTNVNTIGDLLLDLHPWKPLEVNTESSVQNMNIWIGQGSTIAELHYDAYENINIQVTYTRDLFDD